MADPSGDIRIVKKKNAHAGHHGGAWKVAYADFVTAMMAFFLVMWIVGLSNNVRQAVASYFKDPVAFMEAVESGKAPFKISEAAQGGTDEHGSPPPQDASNERARLEAAKQALQKMVSAAPELKNLKEHVDIQLVDEGLRIDLVEARKSMFFDAASAKVKPAAMALLARVARELNALPNKVIIEGHTDPRPLARPGYTNWELSADRANSARKLMEAAGLKRGKVTQVRGYASTQPKDPLNPNHFSNRRVSIIVIQSDALKKQQFDVGPSKPVAAPEPVKIH